MSSASKKKLAYLHLQCLLRHMISAEVEGSGVRVFELGCRPFVEHEEDAGVGVEELSVAGPTLSVDFFFLVMPSKE